MRAVQENGRHKQGLPLTHSRVSKLQKAYQAEPESYLDALEEPTQVSAVYGTDQLLFPQRRGESCKQDYVVTVDETTNVSNIGPLPHGYMAQHVHFLGCS